MINSEFFQREIIKVAQDLVGCFLVVDDKKNQRYQITETEAYLGEEDAASHARFGKTDRSEVMYQLGGTIYVYLIYGLHHMLNIVAGPAGDPGAVLIRGVEEFDGPGKLTKELGITKADYNGKQLGESVGLWIEKRTEGFAVDRIEESPRIGIDYAAEEWRDKLLRFTLSGD